MSNLWVPVCQSFFLTAKDTIIFHTFQPGGINLCEDTDQLVINLIYAKNGVAKRSKEREGELRIMNKS